MDKKLKDEFLADFRIAKNHANKKEEITKVYDKYKDFLLSLNTAEAISLGTEMGVWIKEESIPLN